MKINEPKVSIIIPVYNVEKYLADCLDSVVKQTLDEIEIICVNDGSTDMSACILQQYSCEHTNITIINQENQGLSCARNVGILHSRGEYIYFIDSDDRIEANAMEEMFNLAYKEDLDVLYIDGSAVYENEKLMETFPQYGTAYRRNFSYAEITSGIELFSQMVENGEYCVSASLQFIKREYLQKVNLKFYPGILHEDNLFNFCCMLQAAKVRHVNIAYFIRLIREDSIMTSNKKYPSFQGLYITYSEMLEFVDDNSEKLESKFLKSIYKVIDSIIWVMRNMYLYNLSDEEKEKTSEFLPTGQYRIEKLLGKAPLYANTQYPFPLYLLAPQSKIILYGAGNIGKRYYQQLKEGKYAEIVKWVDKQFYTLREEGFPVDNVESIIDVEYDFVFISIADDKIASEIICNLKQMGVADQRIIWSGEDYCIKSEAQMSLVNKRLELYNQVICGKKKKILLFMTPEHGNLGDYAIAMAERRFFEEFFPDVTLIEVTMPDWKDYAKEYKKIVSECDIVCISGGGYLGNMWQSGSVLKEIVSTFPNNIKFLLPNTLTYINNNEETMKMDAGFYAAQNNLYIFARDENSYRNMLKYQYRENDQIALFPDMALSLNFTCKEKLNRNGVLLCFRQDREKVCSNDIINTIKKILMKNEMSFFETDTHLNRTIKRKSGESELHKKLLEFKQAKLVITDRLHGMIFSAITGTPCIAFNNSTGKVAGVYSWIQELPYIRFVSESEISREMIDESLSLMGYQYENIEIQERMREMAKLIKDVVWAK